MKKAIILLFCFSMLLSCSGDDDNNSSTRLNGSWSMTDYLDMAGPPPLEDGAIVWTFNTGEKKLTVQNNADPALFILSTGTYDIKINGDRLTIILPNYNNELKYYFNGGQLILEIANIENSPLIKFDKL